MDTYSRPPKLMDRVKAIMRVKRHSPRTVKTYCYWIRYFIRFNGLRHPASMDAPKAKAFLERLAIQRHVAATTQHQALKALFSLSACTGKSFIGVRGLLGEGRILATLPPLPVHVKMSGCHPCGSPCVLLGHKSS